ncbi:MAG: hypothetical protein KBT28_03090 [Bacteroidales bacterium]|nr:hypothetical protein [Candidatus Colimorpha merdihippi]
MKSKLIIFAIFLTLSIVCYAQTDIYKLYANRTDIRVASVTNFTLDSGITVDVTLLEAIDDHGWAWICKEFALLNPSEEQQKQIDNGWDVVFFSQRSRQDPTKTVTITDNNIDQANTCYIGVSYLKQTLYIFCYDTTQQNDVIVNYFIEKMRRK